MTMPATKLTPKEMSIENLTRTIEHIMSIRQHVATDTQPAKEVLDAAIEQVTFTQLSFIMMKKKS